MTKPFVSVLIDTYNHERFVEEAINSVLAQDFPASQREILVVDDGSTDATPGILRKFEPHLRILRKANGGQASAFNLGISQCRGEIITFLDGDDWWAPNRLARTVQTMADDPSLGIVGNGIINSYQDGSQLVETLRDGFRFQANTIEGARLLSRRGAFLGTSRMTIRASVLQQIGPVPEDIHIEADEYLFTLASVLSAAQILPEPLTYYRHHGGNLFQLDSYNSQKLRRKLKSLDALATGLSRRLMELAVAPGVRSILLGYMEAFASRIRLQLDGGWPWQTAAAEWKLYSITHPEASMSHRLFKASMLFGALFVPPRAYYGVQHAFAQSGSYLRLRRRFFPIPKVQHIQKDKRSAP
jgi:hypothetical protein